MLREAKPADIAPMSLKYLLWDDPESAGLWVLLLLAIIIPFILKAKENKIDEKKRSYILAGLIEGLRRAKQLHAEHDSPAAADAIDAEIAQHQEELDYLKS